MIYTQGISGMYDNFDFKFKNRSNINFHELDLKFKLRFFLNRKSNRIFIFQTFKILKLQSNYKWYDHIRHPEYLKKYLLT